MSFNKIIVSLFFCLIYGCSYDPIYQKKHYIFGTLVDIKIYGEKEETAKNISNEIIEELNRLHQLLHPWNPGIINDINQAIANDKSININNNEIISIIHDASTLENNTKGIFNPAIGKLVNLWGFHSETLPTKLPSKEAINNLVTLKPSMNNISIKNNILKSRNNSVQIDLGGYGKGYALDQIKNILSVNDIPNALINIGGNILALGKRGSKTWVVAIQNPREPGVIAKISLKPGWSIGTSGDYQKYLINDGIRYSHLINPFTGLPSQGTQSAIVLTPPSVNSGTLSDVYSKPLFIAHKNKKLIVAKSLGLNYFLIIMEDNSIIISRDMMNEISWYQEPDAKNIITN